MGKQGVSSDKIESINPALITELIRGKLNDDSAELVTWSDSPIPLGGASMTASIARIMGTARSGGQLISLSMIVKTLKRIDFKFLLDRLGDKHADSFDPLDIWRHGLLFYRSALPGIIKGSFVPAKCYHAEMIGDEFARLWLEDLGEENDDWPESRHIQTSRHLGEFNGAHLERETATEFRPIKNFLRAHILLCTPAVGWESITETDTWQHDKVANLLPCGTCDRVRRMLNGSGQLMDRLATMPWALSHQDTDRRNLFSRISSNGAVKTVAIDWGFVGVAAVGDDVGSQVWQNLYFLNVLPEKASDYAESSFQAYMEGLRAAGSNETADQVRFAFLSRAIWALAMAPRTITSYVREGEIAGVLGRWIKERGYTLKEAFERWSVALNTIIEAVEQAFTETE